MQTPDSRSGPGASTGAGASTLEPTWSVRVVSNNDGEERVFLVTQRQIRVLRAGVAALSVVAVCFVLGALFTVPRSLAYEGLLHENLSLKARLQDIDRQMSEIDRILLRLRLYDAQLDSIGEPLGDHGPVVSDWVSVAEREIPLDLPVDMDVGPGEGALRPAESWAEGMRARAETFLTLFARAEPNLAQLMEELEGLRALERALPSVWPVAVRASGETPPGALTSGYGWRKSPFGSMWRFHSGIDVAGKRGTPIHAAADGTVLRVEYNAGYGRMIEMDHGFGISTLYAHCQATTVKAGDRVQRGEPIAFVGSTGRSTGPHLHFEVRIDGHAVDPMNYLPR